MGKLGITMVWALKSDKVHKFFNGVNPAANEAYIDVSENGLSSKAINITKTVYVECFEPIDVIGSLPITLPIDVGKLSSVIPKTGETELKFNGDKLQAKSGKTTYKFDIFAPGVVQPVGRELPTGDLPNVVRQVNTKDLHDAVNSILNYKGSDTAIVKCIMEIQDGVFHVHDAEGYVDTVIDGTIEGSNSMVKISTEHLVSITMFCKQYLDSVNINIKNEDAPLLIKYGDEDCYYNYLIAPMVDAD